MRCSVLLCFAAAGTAMMIACASLDGLSGAPSGPADEGGAPDAREDVEADAPRDAGDASPPCSPDLDFTSSEAHCGRCNHDCLGGGCEAGVCQPVVLAGSQAYPFGIAVDATSVYWTTQADGPTPARITKAALDGTKPTPVCPTGSGAVSLALDATNLYFSIQNEYDYCPKAGGAAQLIAKSSGRGVAADGVYAYIIDGPTSPRISRAKAGSLPSLVVTTTAAPEFLAVTDGVVFWTELSSGSVRGCPVGGCMNGSTSFASGRQSPRGIAATASTVYWVESTGVGSVQSCPLTGCAQPVPIAGNQNLPYAVAADASGVYWTTIDEIRMCEASGCGVNGPRTLARGQVSANAIVLDATAVYWANNAKPGQVMRVAK